MAERKIAPLVPPTLARGSGHRLLAGRSTQLQVGELLERPRAGTLVYGMGWLDSDGRLSNRSTIDALGWTAGDCLNIALVGGSVVVHRDSTGAFAMKSKPYLVLPPRSGVAAILVPVAWSSWPRTRTTTSWSCTHSRPSTR